MGEPELSDVGPATQHCLPIRPLVSRRLRLRLLRRQGLWPYGTLYQLGRRHPLCSWEHNQMPWCCDAAHTDDISDLPPHPEAPARVDGLGATSPTPLWAQSPEHPEDMVVLPPSPPRPAAAEHPEDMVVLPPSPPRPAAAAAGAEISPETDETALSPPDTDGKAALARIVMENAKLRKDVAVLRRQLAGFLRHAADCCTGTSSLGLPVGSSLSSPFPEPDPSDFPITMDPPMQALRSEETDVDPTPETLSQDVRVSQIKPQRYYGTSSTSPQKSPPPEVPTAPPPATTAGPPPTTTPLARRVRFAPTLEERVFGQDSPPAELRAPSPATPSCLASVAFPSEEPVKVKKHKYPADVEVATSDAPLKAKRQKSKAVAEA